jgi:hypothetical protein
VQEQDGMRLLVRIYHGARRGTTLGASNRIVCWIAHRHRPTAALVFVTKPPRLSYMTRFECSAAPLTLSLTRSGSTPLTAYSFNSSSVSSCVKIMPAAASAAHNLSLFHFPRTPVCLSAQPASRCCGSLHACCHPCPRHTSRSSVRLALGK